MYVPFVASVILPFDGPLTVVMFTEGPSTSVSFVATVPLTGVSSFVVFTSLLAIGASFIGLTVM